MPAPLECPLRPRDRARLEGMLRKGVQQVRVVVRALALLQLDRGGGASAAARAVGLTPQAVRLIAQRYQRAGVEAAIYDAPRPGAQEILCPSEKQRIIAMVCSAPPAGAARWTVRLVAEEAIKRRVVPQVGRETVRVLLQSHDLKPWREKNVVRG